MTFNFSDFVSITIDDVSEVVCDSKLGFMKVIARDGVYIIDIDGQTFYKLVD